MKDFFFDQTFFKQMLRAKEQQVGSLEVTASSFRPEVPGWIPDAAEDSQSKCGVLPRKIRGSESPVVGR